MIDRKDRLYMTREEIKNFIEQKYGAQPEFLWKEFPEYEIFRHQTNNKWFALIMNVEKKQIRPEWKRTDRCFRC